MADAVKENIDIKAAAPEVFQVAIDFSSYPTWNEQIKEVEIKEFDSKGRGTKVWFKVDARVRTVTYVLTYDYSDEPKSLSWRLEKGDIKELTGSYMFDESDDTTAVTYQIAIDPGFPVPGFLKRQAERQIVKGALEGLKRRVESRQGTGKEA
jgi:uncharacterized membrane protein